MSPAPRIGVEALTVRHGSTVAVDGVSLDLTPGRIHGLLGRNGSGKTSLLSAVASLVRPDSGTVTLDGRPVFEDAHANSEICLVEGGGPVEGLNRVRDVLAFAEAMRPRWDRAYAERLSGLLGLEPTARVKGLPQGGRAALGAVLGLASRAPVTLFDESHLGLDAPDRRLFYQEIRESQRDEPRTVVLAGHLVEETAPVFEEIAILDRGRLLLHEDADALRARGVWATGPAGEIDHLADGLEVLDVRRLGGTASALVHGPLSADRREEADKRGLKLAPASINDLFIHLTDPSRSTP